jgi:probable rRNA maturation factor
MSRTLSIRNRQRLRPVDTALLRRMTRHVLESCLCVTSFELAVHLVASPEMARINKTFLNHDGSTDVITFDHTGEVGLASSSARSPKNQSGADLSHSGNGHDKREARPALHGEIFLCLDDAVKQSRLFRTTWQAEVARYVIHGLLHLCGHDDLKPAARRAMKREENRLLREIGRAFDLVRLETRDAKGEASPAASRTPGSPR